MTQEIFLVVCYMSVVYTVLQPLLQLVTYKVLSDLDVCVCPGRSLCVIIYPINKPEAVPCRCK